MSWQQLQDVAFCCLLIKEERVSGDHSLSPHYDSHCSSCTFSLLTAPQRAGRTSECAAVPVGRTVGQYQDHLLKLIKTFGGKILCLDQKELMCFVFLSHSLDQNALLYVGAAGHRTDLRLDSRHSGREESSDCRNSW